jgi:hypothetical protein
VNGLDVDPFVAAVVGGTQPVMGLCYSGVMSRCLAGDRQTVAGFPRGDSGLLRGGKKGQAIPAACGSSEPQIVLPFTVGAARASLPPGHGLFYAA